MFKEGLEEKREAFRVKIRLDSKKEMLKKFRADIIYHQNYVDKKFDKDRVFRECLADNNDAFQELGNELLERQGASMLLAEAFAEMRRYSSCQHYSWVVMVIVYRMLDILDNYEPLLTAYLPIVDRLIERTNDECTICNGLKTVRLLAPIAPGDIIKLANFPVVLQEYVYEQRRSKRNAFAVATLRILLDKTKDHDVIYKRLMELGVLEVITAVLDNSQKDEEDFIDGLAFICEDSSSCQKVLHDRQLLDTLLVRHTIGSQRTKLSVYKFFDVAVGSSSTHDLLYLVELGLLEILMEGVKSNHCVESIQASLQVLKQLLERTSINCMTESNYLSILKRLEQEKLPEVLMNIMSQFQQLASLCEFILSSYFDSFTSR